MAYNIVLAWICAKEGRRKRKDPGSADLTYIQYGLCYWGVLVVYLFLWRIGRRDVADGRMRDSGDEQVICVTRREIVYNTQIDGELKSHKEVSRYSVTSDLDGQDCDKDEEIEK